MKRIIVLILITISVITVFYLSVPILKAQTFDAKKAFEDYQFQQSLYLTTQAEYEDAKTFYKKNPTLQLREEARRKTLAMLKQRDQLMATYLTALRMQITETTGLTGDERNGIFGKLDPEVTWYQNHMASYQDGDELATLFAKSDESMNRYSNTTKLIVYESLFDITFSQEIGLRTDHQVVYANLKNFINDRVAEGKLTIDPFNRWLNDTDVVLASLSQNEAVARKKISNLYSANYATTQIYNASVQILANSINPLKQLNNYLTEMLVLIESQSP